MVTKREAQFVAQLPDGYDYQFILQNAKHYIIGISADKEPILFRINGDTLTQMVWSFKSGIDNSRNNIQCQNNLQE